MSSGKIFAIGDIHGCAYELELLLQQLPLQKEDTLIFLGDYIDRGPNSKKVIDLIISLGQKYNVISLKGNHESMMNEFLRDPSSAQAGLFIMNGGSSTLASYAQQGDQFEIPQEHVQFFKGLQACFETEDYFFVHAGVPDLPLEDVNPQEHEMEMLWVRSSFHNSQYNWNKTIVHGHTVVSEVEIHPNRINMDTGCVFQGKLSAIELPSQKIYQVDARTDIPHIFLKEDPPSPRRATRFTGSIPVFIHRDGQQKTFQTLNYNEFGMLLQDMDQEAQPIEVGEIISGIIGDDTLNRVEFTGQVVRTQKRDSVILYGVKMMEALKSVGPKKK